MNDLTRKPQIKQQGAVLVVGLIMLLLLTVIGMSSIRGTDLQERMAGNARDHNLAFQASEAAIRSAENYLSGASIAPFVAGSGGYYQDLTGVASPVRWSSTDWSTKAVNIADNTLKGVGEQPKYAIEQLEVTLSPGNYGSGIDQQSLDAMAEKEVYRITARGAGSTKGSEALIQTTFIR